MDGLTQSLLLGSVIMFSITASVFLRPQRDLRRRLFMLFAANLALWYLADFFSRWLSSEVFSRLTLVMALLLPMSGITFFRTFTDARARNWFAQIRLPVLMAIMLLVFVLSPYYEHPVVKGLVLVYVLGFISHVQLELYRHARKITSRVESARINYLVWGGCAAIIFQLFDRLAALGVDLPPVGTSVTLIYMYIVSQTIMRRRLFDLYEMLGRISVLVALAITLTLIFTGMVYWADSAFYLNALLASLVILILFDPLREFVERRIQDFFMVERRDFERKVNNLRRQMSHAFDLNQLNDLLLQGLEETGRITHASIYLMDSGGGFIRHAFIGPAPPPRELKSGDLKNLTGALEKRGSVAVDRLIEERDQLLLSGQRRDAVRLNRVMRVLDELKSDVVVPVETEDRLTGLLCVADERRRDPFTLEEINLIEALSDQLAIGVENSQLYKKEQERDRLVVMGQLAAGLAHEIRNPLGAIKGAAQLIDDTGPEGGTPDDQEKEILGVIVEEVDRLDKVVSAFLDYARPHEGEPEALDVNRVIRHTLQVISSEPREHIGINTELGEDLPMVYVDPGRLQQVFINLVHNAFEAMSEKGDSLSIITRTYADHFVEIVFFNNGPPIPPEVLSKAFIPFFTTKEKGTGLGLAICQSIIKNANGEISISSSDEGTSVNVRLPAAAP